MPYHWCNTSRPAIRILANCIPYPIQRVSKRSPVRKPPYYIRIYNMQVKTWIAMIPTIISSALRYIYMGLAKQANQPASLTIPTTSILANLLFSTYTVTFEIMVSSAAETYNGKGPS
ncbi:hypothetical protein F5B20DRAFT_248552 [Whalleya microplaca]|nr:hypothetical protein F5B20DRAFT_248552 [Whalleya microplaca]